MLVLNKLKIFLDYFELKKLKKENLEFNLFFEFIFLMGFSYLFYYINLNFNSYVGKIFFEVLNPFLIVFLSAILFYILYVLMILETFGLGTIFSHKYLKDNFYTYFTLSFSLLLVSWALIFISSFFNSILIFSFAVLIYIVTQYYFYLNYHRNFFISQKKSLFLTIIHFIINIGLIIFFLKIFYFSLIF